MLRKLQERLWKSKMRKRVEFYFLIWPLYYFLLLFSGECPQNHVYCFGCIEAWSKTENTCPLCKVVFTYIDRYDSVRTIWFPVTMWYLPFLLVRAISGASGSKWEDQKEACTGQAKDATRNLARTAPTTDSRHVTNSRTS